MQDGSDPCPTPAARAAARFSVRAAAVFLLGLAFLAMVLSGVVLVIAPSGRIAGTLDWSVLGLSRPGWERLHLTTGLLFLGAGLWHIVLHWSVIAHLLWSAAARSLCHRRELALAVVGLAVVIAVSAFDWPPASWLETLSRWFRRELW